MIRPATEDDVAAMLAIYAPYVRSSTATFEYEVPTFAQFLTRFRTLRDQFPWLVWEQAGEILGYAYASAPFERAAYRWCAEDSVYLHPDARGQGIGGKLLNALEKLLTMQGYCRIYAIITAENQPSLDFHRAKGYRVVGQFPDCGFKFGRWLGVVWMDKVLKVVESPNQFPVSWMSIIQNGQRNSDILDILSLS